MRMNFPRWSALTLFSLLIAIVEVITISSFLAGCKKDKTPAFPTVTTTTVTNIASMSATTGGTIGDNGGATITASGVVYSTSTTPTLLNSYTTDGTASGAFTSNLIELIPNTTYYVRAYATNSAGTGYGGEVSFTTLP